ncbi:MAG: YkgJ family cysteine cluster protein [Myxococcales bacterium]|nr:YkgJ family cysteine cluster protein [Myxococcales bacterium]
MDDPPARSREPDEDDQPWLTILLDALHILDQGLHHEVSSQEQQRGDRVGCHAGCTACCQSNVRLRPLEIEGIAWYASTRLDDATWGRLRVRLGGPDDGTCPFLLDGQCSVRPVRPITCRTFFVFGEPCKAGERLFQLRSRDIFDPSDALLERTALRLFDDESFGLEDEPAKRAAYHAGRMYRSALGMPDVDWVATIDSLRDAAHGDEG